MAIEKTIILNVETEGAVESIKEVDKSIDKVTDSTQDLTNSFDKLTGGLVSGFKGAVSGIRKGVVAMKSLKVAIAATGVGLLVIAIGSLVTFFTKTESGARKLEVVMAQLGAVIDVIIDRVSAFGEAIFKFFSGDTQGAIDGITNSFSGLGDELEREIRLAKELTLATQELTDLEIDQIVLQSERRKLIAENRLLAKDRSKTLEERIGALKLAQALENAILDDEKANQQERVRIAELDLDRANSDTDDRRALEEEKARLIDLTTASIDRQRTVESELQSLLQEALGGEDEEREVRELVNPITGVSTNELEIITQDQNDILIEQGEELTDELEAQALRRKQILLQELKTKREIQFAQIDLLFQFGAILQQVGEKNKALAIAGIIAQQVASIASIIINTTIANAKAVAQFPTTAGMPFVAFNIISAALGIASGIAATSKAISQLGGGGSPATGAVPRPGGGGGRSESAAPEFNIVGTSPEQQLANTIAEQQERPIEAFVVASSVTTQQALDRNKVETASFGN